MPKAITISLITLSTFLLGTKDLCASHILGAELSLSHSLSNCFEITLSIYSDDINGFPDAVGDEVYVHLFEADSNILIQRIILKKSMSAALKATSRDCSLSTFEATKTVYKGSVLLDLRPSIEHYYLSWERCCRSYNLTNIRSESPGIGIPAGITAVLDFSVSETYKNNTPTLSKLKTDLACTNKPIMIDVSAFDTDGDSIVYSLVTPTSSLDIENGISTAANSKPYPSILWTSGFDANNIVGPGGEAFVDQNGLLKIKAPYEGFFAYSILYEEYRNGIKLSSFPRDFVIPVLSDCSDFYTQPVTLQVINEKDGNQIKNNDVVSFSPGEEVSFQAVIKAPHLVVQGEPLFGSLIVSSIQHNSNILVTNLSDSMITSAGDSILFQFNLPDCLFQNKGILDLTIIGHNNRCPQPEFDSLVFTVIKSVETNSRSEVQMNDKLLTNESLRDTLEFSGRFLQLPIVIQNSDLDSIAIGTCIKLDSLFSISFSLNDSKSLIVQGTAMIDFNCDTYSFNNRSDLSIPVLVSEYNQCGSVYETEYNIEYKFTNINPKPKVVADIFELVLGDEKYEIDLSRIFADTIGQFLTYQALTKDYGDSIKIVDNKLCLLAPSKDVQWSIPITATNELCSSTSVVLLIYFTSITSTNPKQTIQPVLYPNPNNGEYVLRFTSKISEETSILIYDQTGSVKAEVDNIFLQRGINTLVMNTCDFDNGFYYLRVKNQPLINFKYYIIK